MNNAKSARMPTLLELFDDNKNSLLLPQAQVNNQVNVVWTSLGPLPRWVPGPTTRWTPGTTRLALHGT
jgi:hypothetical protein